VNFKNHKKLLSVLKYMITSYSDELVFKNGVKGFFFDIRGKVGVTGDAKKRSFFFNVGRYSKTTKNSKFNYQFNSVRTDTGALGITMIMYY
jgi:ribosomal protein S3